MRLEEIKELMKAMEENGLTSFEYQEGNIHLSLKREDMAAAEDNRNSDKFNINELKNSELISDKALDIDIDKNSNNVKLDSDRRKDTDVKSLNSEPDKIMVSPLVGVFYKASSPDAEPFVKVGDTVKKGQVLGIIEAMKLMNEIESEYDGVVEAILAENEDLVEYGQPLFRIR